MATARRRGPVDDASPPNDWHGLAALDRIVSRLGVGCMGIVYKAFDQRLHRHVALKVLPAAVSADEGRRRLFLREARAASALNDSHIIAIYDIFEHQGTDVLVMELVEGRTLREALAAALWPSPQALDWTRQIAEALGVAHGSGIVHRGPEARQRDGHRSAAALKVLDFGLAKVRRLETMRRSAPGTQTGDFLGTLEYMSPKGPGASPVDHRTDIYSLGSVLYEMLRGRRPVRGREPPFASAGRCAQHAGASAIVAVRGERSAGRCGELRACPGSADALPVHVGVGSRTQAGGEHSRSLRSAVRMGL